MTKPMLQLVLGAVLVFVFFRIASAKRSMVPGKLQYVGEMGYGFVRNSLGRDIIGSKDFMRYVPFLFSLFFFVLIGNVFATIPFFEFPTFSRAGLVYGLVLISWLVYNIAGIKAQGGFGAYLKHQTVPPGVPPADAGAADPARVPLQHPGPAAHAGPATLRQHARRPPAADPVLARWRVPPVHGAALVKPVGVLAWLMFIAIAFLEVLVQFLQAYVFTLLNALYISRRHRRGALRATLFPGPRQGARPQLNTPVEEPSERN